LGGFAPASDFKINGMSGVEVGEDCLFINHFLEIN
jgi:hypothetical protein